MRLLGQFGEYSIDDLDTAILGSGSFATLFKAINQDGQQVAVKTLKEKWIHNTGIVQDFLREGSMLKNELSEHPNIIQGLDYFITKDLSGGPDKPYIVMEWAEKNLHQLRKERKDHVIDAKTAVEYARCLFSAIDFAHQHDVYHFDIHPGNILFDATGELKLADFGLARRYLKTKEGSELMGKMHRMRQEGSLAMDSLKQLPSTILSTVVTSADERNVLISDLNRFTEYMPPEQFNPEVRESTDQKYGIGADIYAISKVVTEMITGNKTGRVGLHTSSLQGTNIEYILEIGGHDRLKIRPTSANEMLKFLGQKNWRKQHLPSNVKVKAAYILAGVAAVALALGGLSIARPHLNRILLNRQYANYTKNINEAENMSITNESDAKTLIESIIVQLQEDPRVPENVQQQALDAQKRIMESYRKFETTERNASQERADSYYQPMQQDLESLLTLGSLSEVETELARVREKLKAHPSIRVQDKVLDVDNWEMHNFIPAKIQGRIDTIKSIKDYRLAKTEIDDLLNYCDTVVFANSVAKRQEIRDLRIAGMDQEEQVLQGFLNRFNQVQTQTESHAYLQAMPQATSLVSDINRSNLIYFAELKAKTRGEAIGDWIAAANNTSGLANIVRQYSNTTIKPNYDLIVNLERESGAKFSRYDRLLQNDEGFELIKCLIEVEGVVKSIDTTYEGYKELKPRFIDYRTKILDRLNVLAQAKVSYFQNKLAQTANNIDSPNLSSTQRDKMKGDLQNLKDEMKRYDPILRYQK